jgi:hypothetical protein
MKCEKTALLKHLSVHNPAALAEEPWSSHVDGCAACREEWHAFAWSLAVYKRIEQEQASHLNLHPYWSAFVRHLAEEETAQHRARAFAAPWLAGIAGLILFGGIVSWGVWSENGEPLLPSFNAQDASPLSVSNPAPRIANRRVPSRMLTSVNSSGLRSSYAGGGGYRRTLAEWRSLPRPASFLEGHTIALDRPSGDLVIMPFGHQRTQNVHLVPIPNNDARFGVPYGVAGPVR